MASIGPSLAGYTPGGQLSPEVWQQLSAMYSNPQMLQALRDMNGGGSEYTDPVTGLNFAPKFKEIAGNQIFDGGTVYKIQGKGTYDTPGDVFDASGKLTNAGFNIHHDKPGFMDNYGFLLPIAAAGGAAALGLGGPAAGGAGAAGAGAGAIDLGGGLMMTADGAIVGATGAFAPATAAEMTAMGLGTAGTAGASIGAGGALTSAAGGAGSAASALGNAGGFDWTKLIGPGLSAVGGIAGANAAKSAADTQLQAAREAQALNEPFRQAGMKGMNRLLDLLGISGNTGAEGYGSAAKTFGASDFNADPGYQFRLDQGQKALERARSSAGLLGSGKYLKDAMNYNQGQASQEYGNAFNRFQTNRASVLNPLQSLMGAGQTAANTVGEYATQGANAAAAGKVGQANALTNALTQGYGMYQNQQQQDQNNALFRTILGRQGGF